MLRAALVGRQLKGGGVVPTYNHEDLKVSGKDTNLQMRSQPADTLISVL